MKQQKECVQFKKKEIKNFNLWFLCYYIAKIMFHLSKSYWYYYAIYGECLNCS